MWFDPVVIAVIAVQWQPIIVAVATGAGATLVGVLSFFGARRTSSGTVATSDAATLWNVAKQLIDDLKAEVGRLRTELTAAELRNGELQGRLTALEAEVERLRRSVNGA